MQADASAWNVWPRRSFLWGLLRGARITGSEATPAVGLAFKLRHYLGSTTH